MRKRIDLTKQYMAVDRGMGRVYIQDGEDYDKFGWSMLEYPDEVKEPKQEVKSGSILLPKSQKPYSTEHLANRAITIRRDCSEDTHVVIQYKDGFAIKAI